MKVYSNFIRQVGVLEVSKSEKVSYFQRFRVHFCKLTFLNFKDHSYQTHLGGHFKLSMTFGGGVFPSETYGNPNNMQNHFFRGRPSFVWHTFSHDCSQPRSPTSLQKSRKKESERHSKITMSEVNHIITFLLCINVACFTFPSPHLIAPVFNL